MNKQLLNRSPNSPFQQYCSQTSPQISEVLKSQNRTFESGLFIGFPEQFQKNVWTQQFKEINLTSRAENCEISQTDSSDSVENTQLNSHTSISQKLNLNIKKRKNKKETKQEIQEKNKDYGRGGNCIASNITKTLIRIIEYKILESVNKKFRQLIERYKIKSQKENTIIILLMLYGMVKTGQISFDMLENIFSFFMKSLIESKDNCEKKMYEEPERKGFHLKNRKMYVNFIKINTELYSQLREALKAENSVKMNLESISDIISDTYDRKQREIQKAISKIQSIILNHVSLKALFGKELNDIESTLFKAVEYAYRRNLPKRCNQTMKKIQKFFNEIQKIQSVQSDEEKFFMCYLALKMVGEKEKEIWNEFMNSLNIKRQFNQTQEEGQKLIVFLNKKIPEMLFRFDFNNLQRTTLNGDVKIEEETEPESCMQKMFQKFVELKNNIEF